MYIIIGQHIRDCITTAEDLRLVSGKFKKKYFILFYTEYEFHPVSIERKYNTDVANHLSNTNFVK